VTGRLLVGTSGFAYPAWSPRFYPPGTPARELLRQYARRLDACELNNTYYQQPSATKVQSWIDATAPSFRFAVKAQRGGSFRAFAVDPVVAVPWLTAPLRAFGERLGTVLFRVPDTAHRDDDRLRAVLGAWPRELPLTVELQHDSWHVDETFTALADAGAVLCATELPDAPTPALRLTGSFLYLRLRRQMYNEVAIETWADRLVPFLASGTDVYAFFRHDDVGFAPGWAELLRGAVAARFGGGR
jgi:uncharacterized protein YecE (DUF72 family)